MLAALVVVLRSLALSCCGHRAVALENSGAPSTVGGVQAHGEASPAPSPRSAVLDAAGQRLANSGAPPCSSCIPTRSSVGIGNGSDGAGPDAHGRPVRAAQARTLPFVPS